MREVREAKYMRKLYCPSILAFIIVFMLMSTAAVQARAQTRAGTVPAGTEFSSNWSGYAVTAANKTTLLQAISGTWRVPAAQANGQAAAAQWIGLGGFSSNNLLQIGTIEAVYDNHQVTELFWEKLPDMAHNIIKISSGTIVAASISENGSGVWQLATTVIKPNGDRITKTIQVAGDVSYDRPMEQSAEWINEDPSNKTENLYKLANTGTLSFTNLSVNNQTLAALGLNRHPLAVTSQANRLLLSPSFLKSHGTAFSVLNLSHTAHPKKMKKARHRFRISHHKLSR